MFFRYSIGVKYTEIRYPSADLPYGEYSNDSLLKDNAGNPSILVIPDATIQR